MCRCSFPRTATRPTEAADDHPRARLVLLAGDRLNRVELRFKREGRESEILDSLVRGLVRTILPAPLDHPRARLVQLAGERLNRVELRFKREGRESEIHLYEGYWASITEGRVTLRDTWRPPSRS